jgi:Tfp pilus assembly protein PilF
MREQMLTRLPPQLTQLTSTPTPPLAQFPTPTLTPIIARAEMRYALDQMAQGQYAQAIQSLDRIIAAEPRADYAYYARAKSYVELSRNQRTQSEFLSYTENALSDINTAQTIQPAFGDYYALRHEILSRLASLETYTVDQVYLYQIAYENLQTAYALGTPMSIPSGL